MYQVFGNNRLCIEWKEKLENSVIKLAKIEDRCVVIINTNIKLSKGCHLASRVIVKEENIIQRLIQERLFH